MKYNICVVSRYIFYLIIPIFLSLVVIIPTREKGVWEGGGVKESSIPSRRQDLHFSDRDITSMPGMRH